MAIFDKKTKIELIQDRLDGLTTELEQLQATIANKIELLDKQRGEAVADLNEVNTLLSLLS